MKNFIKILFYLFLPVIMSSCVGNISPLETMSAFETYPLAQGNTWNYQRSIKFTNIQPGSLTGRFIDTLITENITVRSLGNYKLLGLFDTILLTESFTDSFITNPRYIGRSYYANNADGLFLYGYSGTGLSMPKSTGSFLQLNGHLFRNIEELLGYLEMNRILSIPQRMDSVYLEVPPKKVVEYPIQTGHLWIYREAGDPFRIGKQFSGEDIITVEAGTFLVYHLEWLYDLDNDGMWDEDIRIVDEYAAIGMVKRTITINDIKITDEYLNVLGSYTYLEISELLTYTVQF